MTTTSSTPPVKTDTALRFPVASAGQVRREVARQLARVRHARRWLAVALLLLSLGAAAGVLIPQLMGRIVDLVSGETPGSLWQLSLIHI